MAIREDLVASAVTFLQDPNVTASPIENRIAFLQSKNLTQDEIDAALARAGGEQAPSYSNYAPQQGGRSPQPVGGYGGYQQQQWQQPPPPQVPKRDWRDWFIMATVMGGVGYGLYFVAKRYVYPIIAPPTAPQLEQDKQAIDESFEKAFALLDQLAKDTEALKESEQSRTEKLDQVLADVESAMTEFKGHSERREQDSRRINDEVRGLKDLIPKALEGQKETTENRLKELNTELKSLKTLMGQRMNPPAASSPSPYNRTVTTASPAPSSTTPGNAAGSSSSGPVSPKPASVAGRGGIESVAALHDRTTSTFNSGTPAIPAWQMAAANKSSTSTNATATGSSSQEAAGGA